MNPTILKCIRLMKKKSQGDIAQATGNDAALIRKYENGHLTPKPSTASRIAKALGVNPLVLETDWDPSEEKAMYMLFSLFEKYGGRFENCDGETAILFEGLSELIEDWRQKYGDINARITEQYEGYQRKDAEIVEHPFLRYLAHYRVPEKAGDAEENVATRWGGGLRAELMALAEDPLSVKREKVNGRRRIQRHTGD